MLMRKTLDAPSLLLTLYALKTGKFQMALKSKFFRFAIGLDGE